MTHDIFEQIEIQTRLTWKGVRLASRFVLGDNSYGFSDVALFFLGGSACRLAVNRLFN